MVSVTNMRYAPNFDHCLPSDSKTLTCLASDLKTPIIRYYHESKAGGGAVVEEGLPLLEQEVCEHLFGMNIL